MDVAERKFRIFAPAPRGRVLWSTPEPPASGHAACGAAAPSGVHRDKDGGGAATLVLNTRRRMGYRRITRGEVGGIPREKAAGGGISKSTDGRCLLVAVANQRALQMGKISLSLLFCCIGFFIIPYVQTS